LAARKQRHHQERRWRNPAGKKSVQAGHGLIGCGVTDAVIR
jgi:hypothetical protein